MAKSSESSKIVLKFPDFELYARLLDVPEACEIKKKMPIKGASRRWGEEVYFLVDWAIPNNKGIEEVEVGDIAYWPDGPGIAIFFGKTPVSTSKKPRAYSAVNVFAKIEKPDENALEKLRSVRDSTEITIETRSKIALTST